MITSNDNCTYNIEMNRIKPALLLRGYMAFKIWVNIFGGMGDPKQVCISEKLYEKIRFSPPGGAEHLISRLPGFRKIGSNSFISIDRVKWTPPSDSAGKNTQP